MANAGVLVPELAPAKETVSTLLREGRFGEHEQLMFKILWQYEKLSSDELADPPEDRSNVEKAVQQALSEPVNSEATELVEIQEEEQKVEVEKTVVTERLTQEQKAELVARCVPSYDDLPRDWKSLPLWVVVGGSEKGGMGGILVRCDQDLSSRPYPIKLKTGTLVEEIEQVGNRLHYKRLRGDGPDIGWVTLEHSGKSLVEPYRGTFQSRALE
mmetsp:Transcript_57457/g.95593  ORF Transcript_57457/g.95593 Transcript_57457/m.95593 type:complete len:214 (-) Transcript_57457:70-711(-)